MGRIVMDGIDISFTILAIIIMVFLFQGDPDIFDLLHEYFIKVLSEGMP